MTVKDVAEKMRETATKYPHHVNPAEPTKLANEECERVVEVMGREISVVFTYAIHGGGRPNTWNLSLSELSGEPLHPSAVAILIRAFFGHEASVYELDQRMFPQAMRDTMPKGYRQFFVTEAPVQ